VSEIGTGLRQAAWRLSKLLKDDPVDLVFTATNALNIAALLAARRLGHHAPPILISEHIPLLPFLATRKRPWIRKALMFWLYPRAALIAAPSQPILDEHSALLGRRCPPVAILANPVVDRVVIPPPSLRPRADRMVSLGRLSPEKDFALMLRVFADHHARRPEARLVIHGEGPERSALEGLRDSLGLGEVVSLPGRTDDPSAALTDADLFLCTSRVEGFGNAIVEAQAGGVPVLSVDCPHGPGILLDRGAAGCLVPSRDPKVLGRALSDFAQDLTARECAQTAARKIAASYTIEASAKAHAEMFHRLATVKRAEVIPS